MIPSHATAFLNLALYLVERFGGPERANLAAKVLLVDGHRPSQLPYVAPLPGRFHNDLVVHEIQQHIDSHLEEPLRIGDLAEQFGLSRRSLSRRFIAAAGRAPQAYLQHARSNMRSAYSKQQATLSRRFDVVPATTTPQHSDGLSNKSPG